LKFDTNGILKAGNLSVEKIASMLHPARMNDYIKAFVEAFDAAFVKEEKQKKGTGPETAESGTGKTS